MAVRPKSISRKGSGALLVDRLPPQNVDAERAVLGAMLLNPEAASTAVGLLRDSGEDVFYHGSHQRIYDAMIDLSRRNIAIDVTTLLDVLMRDNQLDEVGGTSYVADLTGAVPTSANVEYYAQIVLETALLRRIIQACTRVAGEAYDTRGDVEALLDRAEQEIFAIAEKRQLNPIHPVRELLAAGIQHVENQLRSEGGVTGLASGITKLDQMLSGFQPSDMIILAARPSVGKTAFGLNIAAHAAIKQQKGVLIFSLEMAKEQLTQRLMFAVGQVNSERLRKGFRSKDEFAKMQQGCDTLSRAQIWIDETPGISVLELRSKARRHAAQHPTDLVIIDYLQLMTGASRSENRQVEIADISRAIKGLARELRVPVIALSQLSREADKDDAGMPKLSHLRESGAIEQDADVVMFLSPLPKHESEGRENVIRLAVAKQRNGPTGQLEILFDRNIQRFRNLAGDGLAEPPAAADSYSEDYDAGEPYEEDDVPF